MAKVAASRKREIEELAERMTRVLESQRRLGGSAYPPTMERLAELCGVNPSNPNVQKAVGKQTFKDQAIVAWNKDRKPARDALVLLTSPAHLDKAAEEAAPVLLLTLLRGLAESKSPALSVSKLKDKLTSRLQKPFQAAIKARLASRTLPPEVGWLSNGQSELVFLLSAVQTSAASAAVESNGANQPTGIVGATTGARDFAPAFRAAYDRLDRDNRSTNFVRLLDLRRALPQFDRAEFDAGLRQLRLDDEFTLSGHEGRLGPLNDDEREAGVREVGSLLVYASRRN